MQISYETLLKVFWQSHTATGRSFSRQYRSAVFYRNEEQRKQAETIKAEIENKNGQPLNTAIEKLSQFYWAEDYHQKYSVRRYGDLMAVFEAMYPDLKGFVNSTAVMRANAFVNGYGAADLLDEEIDQYGLPSAAKETLRAAVARYQQYQR